MAELAGVSVATASRALNGRADVSDETRLAVQRVAKTHGYGTRSRPRSRQRTVNGAHWTGIVGVTMPYSAPTYFATILAGAVEALSERDMRALVCPTGHQHNYEATLIEELVRGETHGAVLVLPEESPEELRALKQQGFHFVVVDPLHELDEDIPVVSAANTSGAYQATAHLLELGHRRIGAITGPTSGLATRRRLMGYHSAQVAAGIMPDAVLEVEGDYLIAGGAAGAHRLLDLSEPPTAILAFNDSMAIGALSAARARGLSIPEDLSVVGFDDTVEAEIAYPPLTTVRQPLKELGRMAVDLLFRLMAEQWSEPLHVELATRLITRSSVSAPPHG
ncbi:MAG TPA: LacI family DNA-binding transcriptional regulator [Solirubrobacteraceae bacterium]|nr:LacI family DNA-binding transcriptional regulator [Solirubrobacteraceae bacterium]